MKNLTYLANEILKNSNNKREFTYIIEMLIKSMKEDDTKHLNIQCEYFFQ